ncbi:GNAT family N-acetyltransferase [Burkholderia anthina]|uniref:GNAT family N-acetyltransferase n=1 Tax=Burkholderia anthina TaxID=179879 RepID=UPI0037BF22D7
MSIVCEKKFDGRNRCYSKKIINMIESNVLITVSAVPVNEVYALRASILLDGDEDASRFPGDHADDTLHLAVKQRGVTVGVASVCGESPPAEIGLGGWRLRGVAVAPEARRLGLGRTLVRLCGIHACGKGGTVLWCTARESAKSFYDSLSFKQVGERFALPGRGDSLFYVMKFDLDG